MLSAEQQKEYEALVKKMDKGQLDAAGYRRKAELEAIRTDRPIVGKKNAPTIGYDRSVIPTSMRPEAKLGGGR